VQAAEELAAENHIAEEQAELGAGTGFERRIGRCIDLVVWLAPGKMAEPVELDPQEQFVGACTVAGIPGTAAEVGIADVKPLRW